jgi:hypothetical protein
MHREEFHEGILNLYTAAWASVDLFSNLSGLVDILQGGFCLKEMPFKRCDFSQQSLENRNSLCDAHYRPDEENCPGQPTVCLQVDR